MRGLIGLILIMTTMTSSTLLVQAQVGCMMSDGFNDPHPVMHDKSKSMFWVRPLEVDADGARNAYHRDDPHGSKGLAIEYMGNGMTISRNGEALEFVPEESKNGEWLSAYRAIVQNGWRAPSGFEIDIYGIAKDKNGNVCVGKDGRLASPTSLVQNSRANLCDPRRYIDALKLPGIVVPNRTESEKPVPGGDPQVAPPFASRGVWRGDLAVVYNPETKIWKGAFIYDTGPRELLGEGSIRLALDLRGEHKLPTSGKETNSLGITETHVVVFPGTAKRLGPGRTWTQSKIQALAEEQFKRWGGGTTEAALEKLLACAAEYKANLQ
jgi:Fungal chitosanase of glycosyl hydrolase group 75